MEKQKKFFERVYHQYPTQTSENRTDSSIKITKDFTLEERWSAIERSGADPQTKKNLLNSEDLANKEAYSKNVENYIGTVKVPVGIAGPVLIHGTFAKGYFFVPLATTEAALVASINRGLRVITLAGTGRALYIDESVQRVPLFGFKDLEDVKKFIEWSFTQIDTYKSLVEKGSRFAKLIDVKHVVEGNRVHIFLDYITGDASGQNMVTFASAAIVRHIYSTCPIPIQDAVLEGGSSSDKKASHKTLFDVRGRRVVVEAIIPKDIVHTILKTTPEKMAFHRFKNVFSHIQIGTIGTHAHAPNALAALYIACGQDPACVAEGHTVISRMEVTKTGDLYACVTLPGLLIGTIGGATGLPSQSACLEIIGVKGKKDGAKILAEVAAMTVLAGEISISASFAAGDFAVAHYALSRGVSAHSDEQASKLLIPSKM